MSKGVLRILTYTMKVDIEMFGREILYDARLLSVIALLVQEDRKTSPVILH